MPDPAPLSPIRVLIVEDHDLFRTGLARYLDSQPDLEVVGQASGGVAGVQLAAELAPDVVLMDLRMPDLHGTEATREILQIHPSARIVVLTVLTEEDDIIAALQAGACAFLVKDSTMAEVTTAVRAAASGSTWLARPAAEAVLGRLRRPQPAHSLERTLDISNLTPREYDVLRLIAQGLENGEIAEALNISPSTAKNHVSSILTKLGLPNRIRAAVYAVRNDVR
jgi:NarL family two-component system response regulator LiaR